MNKLAKINDGDFRPEAAVKPTDAFTRGHARPSRRDVEQAVSTLIRWSGDDP